jgi:hypothetical protein
MSKWKRDGNLVYSLMHQGWKNGKELFCNETMISVSGPDSEALAERIKELLNDAR